MDTLFCHAHVIIQVERNYDALFASKWSIWAGLRWNNASYFREIMNPMGGKANSGMTFR
ncbi:hypothetical protein [Paenibacillus foliorum]|uniref:hypothetical protein n=1 Tax=Paenibacillus foliorum TaxID=2654974 RepID=UPI001C116B50|nr:hypothetical protein [Paenibacillus foliorum]